MNRYVLCVFCVLGCATIAHAQQFDQWNATAESSWTTGADWVFGHPPSGSGGDSALIGVPAPCDLITTASCQELLVSGGTLNIGAGGTLAVSDVAFIGGEPGLLDATSFVNIEDGDFSVPSLSVGTGSAYGQLGMIGGTVTVQGLDLGANGLINIDGGAIYINYPSGSDPIKTIRTLLTASHANEWAAIVGNIVSTFANTNGDYAIGFADSADPGNPAGLPPNTIKIMATLVGDANLDGVVDGDDFTIVASHLGMSTGNWDQGCFEYDGAVSDDDFIGVLTHLGKVSALPTN